MIKKSLQACMDNESLDQFVYLQMANESFGYQIMNMK